MSVTQEQKGCWGIRQARNIGGELYSLIVQMYPPDVAEEVVVFEANKLLLRYDNPVDIFMFKVGKNYRALDDDGKVWNCRYGIFDQKFRDCLTVST
jgi:hypothetical protein